MRPRLFEFEDQPWFPRAFRDLLTEFLDFINLRWNTTPSVVEVLEPVLEKLNCRALVDLGSGSGGPLLGLMEGLNRKAGCSFHAVLTDLYPNIPSFRRIRERSGGCIEFRKGPVDVSDIPEDLCGFRTMFSLFHHLSDEKALKVLADAAGKQTGIAVFEVMNPCKPLLWLACISSPLFIWIYTLRIRPRTFARFFWTYVVPVIPLVCLWDGLISNWRTRTPRDLRRLVARVPAGNYTWTIGEAPSTTGVSVTYLLGIPEAGPPRAE